MLWVFWRTFGGGGEAGLVVARRNRNQREGNRKRCCSYDYPNVVFSGSALVQFEVSGTYTVERRLECGALLRGLSYLGVVAW